MAMLLFAVSAMLSWVYGAFSILLLNADPVGTIAAFGVSGIIAALLAIAFAVRDLK